MSSRDLNPARRGTHHLTVIAALLAMIGPFTIDAYLPSFPDIEMEFGVSRAVLLQSLGIYLLATAISTLAWGPLADRVGRRLVVMVSMCGYTVGSMGCAMADNTESFMFFRVVQGLAASGGFIAGRAMIRDAHDARSAHRAMSQVMLLFALSPAIAPVLGGWLHDMFGWRSVFWFLSMFGGLLALMGYFISETLLVDQRRSIHPSAVLKVYISALKHPRFPALIFCLALSFAGLFLYIAGAPTVIYDFLGMDSTDFGWLFIPIVGGLILGASISARMAHRLPPNRTISIGILIMCLATVINAAVAYLCKPGLVTVIGPMVLYVTGLSIMMPAITVLALDCLPSHRGTIASMQGFLQMVSNAAVASLAVPLLHATWTNFVLGQALFFMIAAALWHRFGQRQER